MADHRDEVRLHAGQLLHAPAGLRRLVDSFQLCQHQGGRGGERGQDLEVGRLEVPVHLVGQDHDPHRPVLESHRYHHGGTSAELAQQPVGIGILVQIVVERTLPGEEHLLDVSVPVQREAVPLDLQ